MSTSNDSAGVIDSETELPWTALYHRISAECDATRAAVLSAQQEVHDELLPRLDRANAVCDSCDVTLRDLLSALRRSTAGESGPSSLSSLAAATASAADGEATYNTASAHGGKTEETRDPRGTPSAPTLLSRQDAQRVAAVEAQLATLTRQVALEQRAFARERQRRSRELQQVRRGIAQMEQCKDQLLVVLRQLQLDKMALLQTCTQHEEESDGIGQDGPGLLSFPRFATRKSSLEGHTTPAKTSLYDAKSQDDVAMADAAALKSLETTVQGLELLMRQERKAREAQVQALATTLQQLEQSTVTESAGDHFHHSTGISPRQTRVPRWTDAEKREDDRAKTDGDASRSSASPWHSHTTQNATRDTNRKLSYPSGAVFSPHPLPKGTSSLTSEDDAHVVHRSNAEVEGSQLHQSAVLLRDRLLRFYALYDPRMIPAVAEVVRQFRGPPEELLATLEMDYRAYGYFSHDLTQ